MQVARLDGKHFDAKTSRSRNKRDSLTSGKEAKGMAASPSVSPVSTGNPFLTAVSHERLYPSLNSSRDTDENGVGGSGRGMEGVVLSGEESGDFLTAQQNNSKLLQLLTSESSVDGDATPPVVGVVLGGNTTPPSFPLQYELSPPNSSERPRSMPFQGHTPRLVTKKSPLATAVSKAPQLLQDHTHKDTPIKTEESSAETTTEPRPSAPPIDVICGGIRKVNSYSGLGKRKSVFPPNSTSSKKTGATGEYPPHAPREKGTVGVASTSSPFNGSLGSALKFLTRMHTTGQDKAASSSPPPPRSVAGSVAPGRDKMAAPSSAAQAGSSASSQASPSGQSVPNRAVSWLEHLKSKLPIQQ